MKYVRVCAQDFEGRTAGAIIDVVPNPQGVRADVIKEVAIADDFDISTMTAVLHTSKWTKAGSPDVYVDPVDGTYFKQDGIFVTFAPDAAKVAAKIIADKTAQITVKYLAMDKDIFDQMEIVFGTRRSDSAAAAQQTFVLMQAQPALFSAGGFSADIPATGFIAGAPLDTDAKVVDYATKRLTQIDTYGVFRLTRIKQFKTERVAILAT